MKTNRLLMMTALAVAAGGAVLAFDPVKPLPKTEVIFFEAGKFTDVRDRWLNDSENARDATLGELRTYLVEHANRLLAPGQQLKITVTDIDRAGEFEPWHGPQWADVRIVKDIYPPRINLAFKLVDTDGRVLKEGTRELTDLAYLMKITLAFSDDPLRHEKGLLDDWLRDEFGNLKKR